MKKMSLKLFILVGTFCFASASANDRASLSADARRAFAKGAIIDISFRVVNSTGDPVEDAQVNIALSQEASERFKSYSGMTDTNGSWRIAVNCSNIANVRVMKEGYYETRIKRHLFSLDYADVNSRIKGKQWSPWKQTVVLKEKRKPTPLVEKGGKHIVPASKHPVGFDFLSGGVVAPIGTGHIEDLMFLYSFQVTNSTGHCSLTLSSVNPDDGMIVLNNDEWSMLKTIYEAPLDGYMPSITFERDWTGRIFSKRKELGANAYIVFRCRAKRDSQDNLISANYGILFGPLDFGRHGKNDKEGMMVFRSIFNPTANDRNLEWDGSGL